MITATMICLAALVGAQQALPHEARAAAKSVNEQELSPSNPIFSPQGIYKAIVDPDTNRLDIVDVKIGRSVISQSLTASLADDIHGRTHIHQWFGDTDEIIVFGSHSHISTSDWTKVFILNLLSGQLYTFPGFFSPDMKWCIAPRTSKPSRGYQEDSSPHFTEDGWGESDGWHYRWEENEWVVYSVKDLMTLSDDLVLASPRTIQSSTSEPLKTPYSMSLSFSKDSRYAYMSGWRPKQSAGTVLGDRHFARINLQSAAWEDYTNWGRPAHPPIRPEQSANADRPLLLPDRLPIALTGKAGPIVTYRDMNMTNLEDIATVTISRSVPVFGTRNAVSVFGRLPAMHEVMLDSDWSAAEVEQLVAWRYYIDYRRQYAGINRPALTPGMGRTLSETSWLLAWNKIDNFLEHSLDPDSYYKAAFLSAVQRSLGVDQGRVKSLLNEMIQATPEGEEVVAEAIGEGRRYEPITGGLLEITERLVQRWGSDPKMPKLIRLTSSQRRALGLRLKTASNTFKTVTTSLDLILPVLMVDLNLTLEQQRLIRFRSLLQGEASPRLLKALNSAILDLASNRELLGSTFASAVESTFAGLAAGSAVPILEKMVLSLQSQTGVLAKLNGQVMAGKLATYASGLGLALTISEFAFRTSELEEALVKGAAAADLAEDLEKISVQTGVDFLKGSGPRELFIYAMAEAYRAGALAESSQRQSDIFSSPLNLSNWAANGWFRLRGGASSKELAAETEAAARNAEAYAQWWRNLELPDSIQFTLAD